MMPNAEYEYTGNKNKKGKKHKQRDEPRDVSSLSVDELKIKVRDCLRRKRYLVVLDDLWKKQDWDEVQDAFLDENKGSRILITSRLKEVALHTSQDPPYYLQFLTEEQSWELFSKKVFRGQEYPSDLELLGKQIVKSCRGLPLSIVVLAGLLANKEKSYKEWSKVVGHVNWYLTRDETQVKDIVLKLSYDELPRRLKSCFLYLGIFPEDFEIHARQLMQRWVAEGFIQGTGSRDPEDVAEDYLHELIDRSLVQVARVKKSGGVKTCRIHDLLRDLCISEGKEDKVFEVCTDNNILIPTKPRRLSIHCNMRHYISSSDNDHSFVRSLICFESSFKVTRSEWKWLSKGFRLVRVLDLEGSYCRKIPSNLGNLIHLRYLSINVVGFPDIPSSICNLWNLQTLNLGGSAMLYFPDEIWKLKQLRHLYARGFMKLRGHHAYSNDNIMWNLQTISFIILNRQASSLIEKGMFPRLRELGLVIWLNYKGNLPKLLLNLQQSSRLNKLEIIFRTEDNKSMECDFGCKPQEVLQSLEHISQLSTLNISNTLDLLTCGASFPPNITKLSLANIGSLDGEGINALGNLTKLQFLRLDGRRTFKYIQDTFDLKCVAGRFSQLQEFHMIFLNVRNWELDNGAMPRLQSLVINNCDRLVSLPNELWSLSALRKVQVMDPSKEMVSMLSNLEMKNGCELIVE